MATATDLHNIRVQFDPDGEGLDFTDMITMQERIHALLFDGIVAGGGPDGLDDPTTPGSCPDPELGVKFTGLAIDTAGVFTQNPGTGYAIAGVAARSVTFVPGVVFTFIEEPFDGAPEAVAPFRFEGGLTLTTAVGDATNPRIDVIEMQLAYIDSDNEMRDFEDATTRQPTSQSTPKRRRIQATIQIKQGTPGASPSYPACSAGFSALAAIWIPATHNAVHDPANIRDLRWPIGNVRVIDVHANQAWLPGSNPWTLQPGAPNPQLAIIGPGSGAGDAYFPCPIASKTARLLAVGAYGVAGASGACRLVRVDHTPTLPTITELVLFDSDLFDTEAFRVSSAVKMMDELANAAPETKGARAANTRNGTPWWCSGYSAGAARPRSAMADTHGTHLALKFSGADNVNRVHFVRWFIAEGM